ncbi:phosphoglycerate mutase-like protein 4 [Juglans microcarpa x Juglans regia]|uniref:phosphoglycerate mutase-like protein 4 n=1 Tax=Juglans microcarpa x Juglans regia TaxID=2249226 RepID=UPI001B7F5018|nr:phosphoglycerate mutase-like protein 4 [Juglans microcarpa x Juglans regia]
MIVLRIWRTATPPLLSSPFTSSQPIQPPPPNLTFPVSKISLGFNGARSLTFTRRRTNHQPRTANSYMADVDSSVVNPTNAEIIVVRHGETDWNADGRIQGHLDVELNDAGRQQAAAVADRLSREPSISVVYSSDFKRALETAQIIAASCGGLEVVKKPDLRERHLGDLQGLVLREAAKLSPKAYQAFLNQRTDQEIPGGGESLDQLYERCTSSLERIGKKHKGERVIVVTHGGVIRTLYKRACPNGRPRGKVLNTSINIFRLSDKDEWTIKLWGDVSHLDKTGFLESGFGGDRTSG